MSEYRTKIGSKFGHKEISFALNDHSGIDPSWLINHFETSIAIGKCYKSDETIQVGWMFVLLKESRTGDLEIWEPQFDSIPIKWLTQVNNTLRHLILQKSVAELMGIEPVFPSLLHFGLASKSFLSDRKETAFFMSREISTGNDSGWRFSIHKETSDEKKPHSLFELSFYSPLIVPFLALPPASSILKDEKELVVTCRESSVNSKQSDLLHKLTQSGVLV